MRRVVASRRPEVRSAIVACAIVACSALAGCEVDAPALARAPAPPSPPSAGAPAHVSPAHPRVTIAATGDVLLHIKVNRAADAHRASGGYRHVFSGVREVLREDEIAFANLETPLVDDVNPPETGEPPVLGARAEAASAMAWAGLDVLSLANNHAYDQRSSGLARTAAIVEAAGLVPVGAGADAAAAYAPRLVERGGMRVAFLACAAFVNRGAGDRPAEAVVATVGDESALLAAIRAARRVADVVVLSVHWSSDYKREVLPSQRRMAARWIDAGADLVLGTGPHLLQEVERRSSPRGDAFVAYSLGNLVSNQGNRYVPGRGPIPGAHPVLTLAETRDAVVLRATFVRDGEGRLAIEALAAEPLWTENNRLAHEARLAPALDIHVAPHARIEAALRDERRIAIARALGPDVVLAAAATR